MDKQTQKVMTADDILGAYDVEYQRIPGVKPGSEIVIRSITAGELVEWQEAGEGVAKKTASIRLIIRSVVDGDPSVDKLPDGSAATGKPIFNDSHIAALRNKSVKFTERVTRSIVELNGLNVKDGKTAAEVDAKKD